MVVGSRKLYQLPCGMSPRVETWRMLKYVVEEINNNLLWLLKDTDEDADSNFGLLRRFTYLHNQDIIGLRIHA